MSASRLWKDICALDSNHVRAQMIERLAGRTDILMALSRVGLYDGMMDWLMAYRRGEMRPFPFTADGYPIQGSGGVASAAAADRIQHEPPPPPQILYGRAGSGTTAIVISPAAKALDHFQQCLDLLGISEEEQLTYERLKSGYKRASLRAHPDKGGSKEAFDSVRQAFLYVEAVLNRINPRFTPADAERMTGAVTAERAAAHRAISAPALPDEPPVVLSAKKLDMSTFNRLFEENRLPDAARDRGYGDWLKGGGGSDEITVDPRLAGGKKITPQAFESVFRERVGTTAIQVRTAPDALIAQGGTELGGDTSNFTAPMGAGVQFTDLKEAYTTGATMYQEVANVKISGRGPVSVERARAQRDAEMARVDPDESARFAAAAAALEERERARRMRQAQEEVAQESWAERMRRRLLVNT